MFSEAISSISWRWRPSSRRIASATSGSLLRKDAVNSAVGIARGFAGLEVADIKALRAPDETRRRQGKNPGLPGK